MSAPAGPYQPFHGSIRPELLEKEREAWLERNRAAIDAYNKRVERDGTFGDGVRVF